MELSWGVVATILAPLDVIERFAAWHLELGAKSVLIYLDDANESKASSLNRHPCIQAQLCTQEYWEETFEMRPKKLQVRQVVNATHAYRLSGGIDWLAHIDVDEFMVPNDGSTVAASLGEVSSEIVMARMQMVESLAPETGEIGGRMFFKACHSDRDVRHVVTEHIYPEFGKYLNGGFIGHIQGKVFVRTGIEALVLRIHNATISQMTALETTLDGIDLGHFHAPTWDSFMHDFYQRLEQGSYRSDNKHASGNRVNALLRRSELFRRVLDKEGEAGMRRIFDSVAVAREPLLSNLRAAGLLREHNMAFEACTKRQFLR